MTGSSDIGVYGGIMCGFLFFSLITFVGVGVMWLVEFIADIPYMYYAFRYKRMLDKNTKKVIPEPINYIGD